MTINNSNIINKKRPNDCRSWVDLLSFCAAPLFLMVLNSLQPGDSCLMRMSVSVSWLKKNTIVKETAKRRCSRFITTQSKIVECECKLTFFFFLREEKLLYVEMKAAITQQSPEKPINMHHLCELCFHRNVWKMMIWKRSENRKCRS